MTQMFNVLTIAFKNTPTRGHQFLVWFYIVTKRECQCLMLYNMTSISNFPNVYISLRNMIYQMRCQILILFLYKGFSHCNFYIKSCNSLKRLLKHIHIYIYIYILYYRFEKSFILSDLLCLIFYHKVFLSCNSW